MAYTPAVNTVASGNFPNALAVYYERKAIPNLKASTPFLGCTKQWPLPLHSGNVIQFYSYNLLGANVGQTTEGFVGSPVPESSVKIQATIGQYADYTNSSDLFLDTAIDDKGALSSLAEEMNYRLALTLNQLVSTSADALNGIDIAVNQQLSLGTYLTASNLRTIAQQLESVNVRPFEDNTYAGVINPLVVHDLYNDASFNGLTDIMKRQGDTAKKLFEGLDRDAPLEFAGIKFKSTTTAAAVTISSNLYYPTYIFGDDALLSIFLGPNPADKNKKNYSLNIQMAPEGGSVSDPARLIGGWISYNVKFVVTPPPGTVMRARKILSQTSSS